MMSQNQITERKRKLRADMKQKRDGINQEERKRWSGAICRNLQNQPAFRKAETVCFYYPLGSEVNLLPLAQTTLDLGIRTGILQRFPIALRLAFVIKCSS